MFILSLFDWGFKWNISVLFDFCFISFIFISGNLLIKGSVDIFCLNNIGFITNFSWFE